MTFKLDHIAISVKDVNRSVTFYKTIFGLKEIKNTASKSKTRWLVFSDSKQIHLIHRPDLEVITNKAVHFALASPDFDAFILHLESLNIDYSDWLGTKEKNYVRDDGIKQVYFKDPDGYWIEVNNDV